MAYEERIEDFSGTMPLELRAGKSNCLIRRGGEFCFCSEAKGCMVEKDSEHE